MQHRATQVAIGAIVVVLGIIGFTELRDATLSTHEHVPSDTQIELILSVDRKGGNLATQSTGEMAQALVSMCRLEVKSDLSEPLENLGDGLFRGVLVPSMDPTDRRQFRGCLEDWSIDHIRADVLRLEEIG